MNPKVTLVTIHHNNPTYLEEYARALRANTNYKNFNLVLIDNVPLASREEFLAKILVILEPIKVKVILNDKIKSFSENCNLGAKHADGELLCFISDDVVPDKNWLTEMVKTMKRHKDCGVVGARLWFPNQMIQHCGVAFHKNKMPGHIWWNQIHKDDERCKKEREFVAVTGACMLINSVLFKNSGGFCTKYERGGYEDMDFCLRVREKGHKIFYSPKAGAIHYEKVTQNKLDPFIRQSYFVKNTKLFMEKWMDKIVPDYHLYEPGVE